MPIILTAADAVKVRGISPSNPSCAIDPVPWKNDKFLLDEEVLTDPAHADVRAFLDALPRANVPAASRYGLSLNAATNAAEAAELQARAIPHWKDVGKRKPIG